MYVHDCNIVVQSMPGTSNTTLRQRVSSVITNRAGRLSLALRAVQMPKLLQQVLGVSQWACATLAGEADSSRSELHECPVPNVWMERDRMSQNSNQPGGRGEDALLLAAGLADLALSRVGPAVGRLRGLLRRSDLAGLAGEVETDLKARGRVALDRYAAVPEAHLEILARQVVARRGASGDV